MSSRSLRATVQGGSLLGAPRFGAFLRALLTKYRPRYWGRWLRQLTRYDAVLLPLPVDPVKPDLFLPHAPIAVGDRTSPLPTETGALADLGYEWQGQRKSVTDFLDSTETDVVLFVHDGAVVGQWFANGWSADRPHQGWSTTKSFVSSAVGRAFDQGLIGLDDPIERHLPALTDTAWAGTTIRNILLMRSGVYWDEHTEKLGENTQVRQWRDHIVDNITGGRRGRTRNEFLAALPRVAPQGQRFTYNSANTQVLAWLLETVYDEPFNVVLSRQLWQPMGMEAPANIVTDRTGAALGSQGLYATPRDFARLGELLRRGGMTADGERVLSDEWVRLATTGMLPARDADDTHDVGYGFQWWSGATPDGFQANGFLGQFITVDPQARLTGVRLAHTLQLTRRLRFAGQGKAEWQTLFRAAADSLSSDPCRGSTG
ncbi:serine hydrolase domain-containing protein [Gordonia sp. (in: high G+C Gram-positive bacteria)]|uniref:serine hydrolase domain-containing protein n=1 Tax=Gordonia sp. (in: high G+C Gram-positive bacteria) TaxID=84139 RepID=UPI0039E49029